MRHLSPSTIHVRGTHAALSPPAAATTEDMDAVTSRTGARTRRRPPARRAKTFTGCATCRSRHLKCDEGRPTCRRCEYSLLKCEGYPGYRSTVQWKSVRGPSDFLDRGRERSLEGQASTPVTRESISSAAVDETGDETALLSGPSTPQTSLAPSYVPTSGASQYGTASDPASLGGLHSLSDSTIDLSPRLLSCRPPAAERLQAVSTDARTSPIDKLLYDALSTQCPKSHLDQLDNLDCQRQLIEHWVANLSDALMPIPGEVNPFKTIFVPLVNEGAHSPSTSSSGSVALFYLVCAASAFHLAAATHRQNGFLALALSHQSAGVRHLRQNLSKNDPSQNESILASLLVCLLYEPATVQSDFWLTHLRGAAKWLQGTEVSALTCSTSSAILYQNLLGTITFMRSQLLVEDFAHHESLCISSKTLFGPYYLLQILGIPKQTLQMVSDVVTLAVKARQHNVIESQLLDRMEIELYLSMPENLQYPHQREPGLSYHYSCLFYFASIIYFKRVLRKALPEEVSTVVAQSMHHIEALVNCTSRPFSPFVWPIAITIFEAQDANIQKRAIASIDFMIERSTLSIWKRLKPLFLKFWSRRISSGRVDMPWDEFLSNSSGAFTMLV